jgi:integrase
MSMLEELRAQNAGLVSKLAAIDNAKGRAVVLTAEQFNALFSEWVEAQRAMGVLEVTITSRSVTRRALSMWLDGEPITIDSLRLFFIAASKNYAAGTVQQFRKTISALFNWAVAEGAVAINPVPLAPLPKLTWLPRRRPYTHEEYLKLRDHAVCLQDRWFIVAAYNLGLRTSGVCWLKWKDVDLDQRLVRTVEPKVRRVGIQSVVPYVPGGDVEKCLDELHLQRNDLDDSFPGAGFVCKRLAMQFASTPRLPGYTFWSVCQRAGVECLGPHSLRRSFISNIANHSGLNHVAAMKLTGHKSFKTYSQYVTVDDEALADGLVRAFAKVQAKSVAMKQLKAHNG